MLLSDTSAVESLVYLYLLMHVLVEINISDATTNVFVLVSLKLK
jgi:hypothetical protein